MKIYIVMFRNKRYYDAVPKLYFYAKKEAKEYIKNKTSINGDWFVISLNKG